MAADQRVTEGKSLVEVAHQLDVSSSGRADCRDSGQVVRQPFPSQSKLEPRELAFGHERGRFAGKLLDRSQPEPIAVIGGAQTPRPPQRNPAARTPPPPAPPP